LNYVFEVLQKVGNLSREKHVNTFFAFLSSLYGVQPAANS